MRPPQAPDPALEHLLQLPPHERVAVVKPVWRSLDETKRAGLLSVDITELKQEAKKYADIARQHAGAQQRTVCAVVAATMHTQACCVPMDVIAQIWIQ